MIMTSQIKNVFSEQSLRLYLNIFLILLLMDFALGRVLQRVYSPFATVGLVVSTFAILLEFVILISLFFIFYGQKGSILTKLTAGMVILVTFLAGTISYVTFIDKSSPPEVSLLFKIVSLLTIASAIFQKIHSEKLEKGRRVVSYIAFSALLTSYIFAYYYQIAVILASHYLLASPFYAEVFQIGQYMLLVAFFFLFAYSISVPCRNFIMNLRIFSKTALIPTLLLGPPLLATIFYFRVTQYLAMLMAEILGFAFSRIEVAFFMLSVWFLFTGILILREKGHLSKTGHLGRESMALAIVFLGGFLFGFVYYFLIGVLGALLLSAPIETAVNVPKEAEKISITTITSKQIPDTSLSDRTSSGRNVW